MNASSRPRSYGPVKSIFPCCLNSRAAPFHQQNFMKTKVFLVFLNSGTGSRAVLEIKPNCPYWRLCQKSRQNRSVSHVHSSRNCPQQRQEFDQQSKSQTAFCQRGDTVRPPNELAPKIFLANLRCKMRKLDSRPSRANTSRGMVQFLRLKAPTKSVDVIKWNAGKLEKEVGCQIILAKERKRELNRRSNFVKRLK